MINLMVDEAYAFDYLSILHVKLSLNGSDANLKAFLECKESLKREFGDDPYDFFEEVFNSPLYKKLYDANLLVFNLVEKAKTDEVKASDVDRGNYFRFIAKKELQAKFFNSSINESKIGYEIYEN